MDSNLYGKTPVHVQKKSGFDKSFQNLFTSKVGTLTPILVDEVIPNTSINLKAAISAQLPPLASDTFMRCKLKYAAFFVPTRLLMPGYEKWLTNSEGTTPTLRPPMISFVCNTGRTEEQRKEIISKLSPGSLSDYLGVKYTTDTLESQILSGLTGFRLNVSALPYLAYHKIYNDWFRNSLVQTDIFSSDINLSQYYNASRSAIQSPTETGNKYFIAYEGVSYSINSSSSPLFNDGHNILDLRQANFDIDLLTNASPQAQNGQAQKVSFSTTGSTGEFTISALRAANSMQQFLERNNIAGNRLVDYVKAQYGSNLSDSIAQRPILLGSGAFDVYSKGVSQTSNSTGQTNNPFNSVAATYGKAFAEGNYKLIENFTAAEPGYVMVIAWLSPKVTYGTGINPILDRYLVQKSQSDLANPILQNVGNEPIYTRQFSDTLMAQTSPNSSNRDWIFGYNDRYFNWKDKVDEVHGLLRDGETLQSFALQRNFKSYNTGGTGSISSDFLKIPTDYLNQVSAVDGDVSNYGYWCDTYFDYKVSMPLARYSVPTLQDPAAEHGETIVLEKGGKHLS